MQTKSLKIGDHDFTSRLFIGTGKFANNQLMSDALDASGSELITVALRRVETLQASTTHSLRASHAPMSSSYPTPLAHAMPTRRSTQHN